MVPGHKLFLLVFNFLSLLLYSGTVFGWTALSEILLKEDFYGYLCKDGPPCDAQTEALNTAFTLASTAYGLSSLPGGLLLDKFGPLVTIIVGGGIGVASVAGITCLRWTFHTFQIDLFPLFLVGVAIGGSLIRFCGYTVGFLFPSKSALLIAIASVLFDGSCLVFPVLQAIFNNGVSFEALFGGYAVLGLVIFTMLPIAWKMNMPEMRRLRAEAKARQGAGGIASQTIFQQMQSLEFVAILLFSIIQLTHSNVYIGSVNEVNAEIARKQGASAETLFQVDTIVSFVIPLGFLAVPAITFSINNFGNVGTLQITNILGVILNTLQLIPHLWLQTLTVCVFATFRAFLFSNVPQFNAHYFGVLNMGRIQGVCFLAGGLLNLVQVPLVNFSLKIDDFTPMLLLCIVMTAVPVVPCVALQCRERRQVRAELLAAGLTSAPRSLSRSSSLDCVAGIGDGIRRSQSLGVLASPMHGSCSSFQPFLRPSPSGSLGDITPQDENLGVSMVEEAPR
eukprot:TRINITY_DN32571_c0_g1_i1.p1 TRINITY_DN32571_c0_g1~~TRINITY_DN32571_c0_g1_i1.p1  ORF type:complete len:528 (+),score=63.34 TRINITY_DN32571_c0_g1_i1:65-1585(+)